MHGVGSFLADSAWVLAGLSVVCLVILAMGFISDWFIFVWLPVFFIASVGLATYAHHHILPRRKS